MASLLEEFVVKFGFKSDHKQVEKFTDSLKGLGTRMLEVTGIASILQLSISAAFKQMQSGATAVGDTSKIIGVSSDRLQKWKAAVEEVGASGDNLASTMQRINASIGSLSTANPDTKFLTNNAIFGINASNAEQYLLQVSNLIGKIKDPNRKLSIVEQLGLSPQSLLYLEQGSKKLKDLVNSQEVIYSKGFISDSNKTRASLRQLDDTVKSIAVSIFTELSPAINELLKNLNAWIKANKELIGGSLKTFIVGLAKVFGFLGDHIKAISYIFGGLMAMKIFSFFGRLISMLTGVGRAIVGSGILKLIKSNPLATLATAVVSSASVGAKEIAESYKTPQKKASNMLNYTSSGFMNFGVAQNLVKEANEANKKINNNNFVMPRNSGISLPGAMPGNYSPVFNINLTSMSDNNAALSRAIRSEIDAHASSMQKNIMTSTAV